MKILCVVGARPNFMKVAPIIREIDRLNKDISPSKKIKRVLVHTGQHYDKDMSDSFFKDLQLPKPDVFLGVGSGSHAFQTYEIMKNFEGVVSREKPGVVVVVGDVNSTIGCALVASKISYDSNGTRPLIAHVEAGLRSFDRSMPEEINRILTDHISDFLFVTEKSGIKNLKREGISSNKIHFVGNTMIDTLLAFRKKAEESTILERLGLTIKNQESGTRNQVSASWNQKPESWNLNPDTSRFQAQKSSLSTQRLVFPYALLTLHRPSNVDNRRTFLNIIQALIKISKKYPIIFPCHPRTRNTIEDFGFKKLFNFDLNNFASHPNKSINLINSINLIDPLGYIDFLCLMTNAKLVFTDSGGIQEETTILGVPCITLRENTERPVTNMKGTNILAGVDRKKIIKAFFRQANNKYSPKAPPLWDGKAGVRILKIIINKLEGKRGFRVK